jgi:hypothetical protein
MENVLTLELTFGDKDLPDKYLLARPSFMNVNDMGDIYVSDEKCIKVYTKDGKPKLIIGGPGQGPGEFERDPSVLISPSGFLTAGVSGFYAYYNIFSPDNKFIEKRRIVVDDLFKKIDEKFVPTGQDIIQSYYVLSKDEAFFHGVINYYDKNEAIGICYNVLIYEDSGIYNVLVKQERKENYIARFGNQIMSGGTIILGRIVYRLLPDKKLVYTHTGFTSHIKNNQAFYTLHIISLDKPEKQDLEIPCTLEKIPDSYIENFKKSSSGNNKIDDEIKDLMVKRLKEAQYLPPFSYMTNDNFYLFTIKDDEKTKIEHIECIDLKTGKILSTFDLPPDKSLGLVKNRYAYNLKRGDKDTYPVVEKYRIDPWVYGK